MVSFIVKLTPNLRRCIDFFPRDLDGFLGRVFIHLISFDVGMLAKTMATQPFRKSFLDVLLQGTKLDLTVIRS